MNDSPTTPSQTTTRLEPLYSLLKEAPIASLQSMMLELDRFNEYQLDNNYQGLGITGRQMRDQLQLAMESRSNEQLTIF